jgi:AcrR family transcriptional regulator
MPSTAQRKQSQRQRLLSAATDIAARDGYEATTISQIIADAGVSRPTFYDYFADKDECLVSTIIVGREHLRSEVEEKVDAQPPARAVYATIEAIFEFCIEHPATARVLLDVSLAGPPEALDARSDGITAVARVIDAAHGVVPADELLPDIGSSALIAGIQRLLGASLRRDDIPDSAMLDAVLSWAERYDTPAGQLRWSTLGMSSSTGPRAVVPQLPFGRAPGASEYDYPNGRIEHARKRLLFAAGELCESQGISRTTLADISGRSGVSYRTLKRLYSTKEDLFIALNEAACKRTLSVAFGAYFSSCAWPQRVWSAARIYAEFVAKTPVVGHIAFVDSYAAGPRAASSTDKALETFTLFLADGDAHLPTGVERPPQVARDAIAATLFDLCYSECRAGKSTELPCLLPQAAFVALTPFLGPQASSQFIDSKLDTLRSLSGETKNGGA